MTLTQPPLPYLGLLPNLGGSLKDALKGGQLARLFDYYFKAYVEKFQHIHYFSYQSEHLSDYTADPHLLQKVTVFPKASSASYRVYALQLPWLLKDQIQPCHVLRVFQTPGGLPALLIKLRYGIPYIVTYGYKYHQFNQIEGRPLYGLFLKVVLPIILRAAAGVIVTTSELKEYVAGFAQPAHIHLIPNGVDTSLFSPVPNRLENNLRPTILFVGRLTFQKNLNRLLEAVAQLANNLTPHLLIVGDGPLKDELTNLAKALNLKVEFTGVLPYTTLPQIFKRANMFVLPSLAEGHPKVLIEAMSCGLPCVVSNCEGNRTVIQDGKTGLLFDPLDTAEMSRKLNRVIVNHTLAQTLGSAARQHILQHYDIRQLVSQEIELLYQVARSSSKETI